MEASKYNYKIFDAPNLASASQVAAGFINPVLVPVEENGQIVDIEVTYPDDFTEQMLDYSERFSFLPDEN